MRLILRCYDCPKHTGENGTFDNLNDALEHTKKYPNHIIYFEIQELKEI